jgi:ubiquinone/menaquinone biosynthesis C-methylase UbiE
VRGIEQIPWLYDPLMALSERLGMKRWRRALMEGVRGRALDLGCGTGRLLPRFPAGSRAIGLDPGIEVLRRARRRAPGVPLVQARAEALPFRDAVFDTVVSSLVFCSVGEPRAGLREVRRVLRPDGRLRMLEHVRAAGLTGRLQDVLQPVWTRVSGGCHPNRDTEGAVKDAGFRIAPETRRAEKTLRLFSAGPEAPPPA